MLTDRKEYKFESRWKRFFICNRCCLLTAVERFQVAAIILIAVTWNTSEIKMKEMPLKYFQEEYQPKYITDDDTQCPLINLTGVFLTLVLLHSQ